MVLRRSAFHQQQIRKKIMKSIISFLAITTLSLAATAFAQEESPSPTEEKPSATVEETPAPAPVTEQTPVVAPAPEKASTPMAEKSAGPAETKKATPVKSASPAGMAAPAANASRKMSPDASIKDMENRWETAVAAHDATTVQGFVAADFMGVSSRGKFTGKSGVLSEIKNKDTYKSAKNERLNLRMYGPNVAVVTGRAREKGTGADGKPFDRAYLFTDTWMARGGHWQCIASQSSQIK